MKTKTLAQVDGFIGIIAGAILAFLPIFMVFLAAISEDEDAAGLILGIIFRCILFSENCNPHSWNPLTCLL